MLTCEALVHVYFAVADPEISRWGANLLFGLIFAKNCVKMKKIGLRGGTKDRQIIPVVLNLCRSILVHFCWVSVQFQVIPKTCIITCVTNYHDWVILTSVCKLKINVIKFYHWLTWYTLSAHLIQNTQTNYIQRIFNHLLFWIFRLLFNVSFQFSLLTFISTQFFIFNCVKTWVKRQVMQLISLHQN